MRRHSTLKLVKPAELRKGARIAGNLFFSKIDRWRVCRKYVSRPHHLQIEPTTRCNLSCLYCISSIWDRKGIDMKLEDFKRIVDQNPFVSSIHLQGFGEPLLCADLFPMIQYAKSHGIEIGTGTNGTLLTRENIQKILESGLDYLGISVDGSTPDTFEAIRRGTSFHQIMKNINNLLEHRGSSEKPRITFSVCVSNRNFRELPEIIQLAGEMGIEGVSALQALSFHEDSIRSRLNDSEFQISPAETNEILLESVSLAKKLHMPFDWCGSGQRGLDLISRGASLQNVREMCKKISYMCYISADGYVTACVQNTNPERDNFGNVFKTDLIDLWRSPSYRDFRERFYRGEIPDYCRYCTVVHS